MGGTFIRLCEQGHQVHVAYQTSGDIAVWDESALRHVDFVREFALSFPELGSAFAEQIDRRIESFLATKAPGEIDSPELQRVKAIFRRQSRLSAHDEVITIGAATVNLRKHELLKGRKKLPLTFYEVELLKLLHEKAENPVSRDEILDKIWGVQAYPTNRTVDNFIVKLRRKLEDDHKRPKHILTFYGYGYKLVP